jgi:tRNA pseudouridine32 synthase/23S rRNA pseudouridine746 synthase
LTQPAIKDQFFTPFGKIPDESLIPDHFILLVDGPHQLCKFAATDLQIYLQTQKEWNHNFGLGEDGNGRVIGKMFGVLVVETTQNEIGYLAAFSGKLAGGNNHSKFVPAVFDALTENSFLNNGMAELNAINLEIKRLKIEEDQDHEIHDLKKKRKALSVTLQKELFSSYHFLNKAGEEKSLNQLFSDASYKNPPAGAGECAGPKLLQYAFQKKMKPLALAEFWWGLSPKSDLWQHGCFYPCCREKCEPILVHMLEGID